MHEQEETSCEKEAQKGGGTRSGKTQGSAGREKDCLTGKVIERSPFFF
jgi:hypothetical protein